jgi:FimV-like protein
VLRLDPKQVSSNLNLASIYMAEGQKDRARRHLSTVLAVAPDNQQAAAMLRQLGL